MKDTRKAPIYMEKAKARSAPQKTELFRKRNPWIAVAFIGLVVIVACVLPAPILPGPSGSETPSVTEATSETAAPTRTATPEPSSTATFTGTEIIEATLTLLPDYRIDDQRVPMAYVPQGVFAMGNDRGSADEQPIHPVTLDAFYIDKFEVTNELYEACVEAGDCRPVKKKESATRSDYYSNRRYIRFPVIFVDWNMAQAYCEWRDARLPTEAEWEKAARGGNSISVTYPWGDAPDCNLANYGNCLGDTTGATIYDLGKSRYGVYNMAGNVWEWVSDWYADDYYRSSPRDDPQGPDMGNEKVLRGGSWKADYADMRSVNRAAENPRSSSNDIGFRCAKDANP